MAYPVIVIIIFIVLSSHIILILEDLKNQGMICWCWGCIGVTSEGFYNVSWFGRFLCMAHVLKDSFDRYKNLGCQRTDWKELMGDIRS